MYRNKYFRIYFLWGITISFIAGSIDNTFENSKNVKTQTITVRENSIGQDVIIEPLPGGVLYRKSGTARILRAEWTVYIVFNVEDKSKSKLKKEAILFLKTITRLQQRAMTKLDIRNNYIFRKILTKFKTDLEYLKEELKG
jgi:hypothetical protein